MEQISARNRASLLITGRYKLAPITTPIILIAPLFAARKYDIKRTTDTPSGNFELKTGFAPDAKTRHPVLYQRVEWGWGSRPTRQPQPSAPRPCRPGVCSCMPTRDLSCRSLSPFPSFLLLSRRPQTSPNRVERLFKLSSHYPLDRRPDLPPSLPSESPRTASLFLLHRRA